jgi:hypothetical protein
MDENQNKVTNKQTNKLRANLPESPKTETKSLAMFSTSGTWKLDCRNATAEPTRRRSCEAILQGTNLRTNLRQICCQDIR